MDLKFGVCLVTLPETNISPENRPGPKRKVIFQPSIFRGENVSFREGILIILFFFLGDGFPTKVEPPRQPWLVDP